jgi:hypothetical protein
VRYVILQLVELAREVPVLFAEVNNVGACAAIQTPKQCIYLQGVEGFDYGVKTYLKNSSNGMVSCRISEVYALVSRAELGTCRGATKQPRATASDTIIRGSRFCL